MGVLGYIVDTDQRRITDRGTSADHSRNCDHDRRTHSTLAQEIAMSKSPKYDFQREEVYAWEYNFSTLKCSVLSPKDFKTIVNLVCTRYKVKRPTIGTMKSKMYAAQCYPSGYIEFDKKFRSAFVLVHELAHYVLDQYGHHRNFHHPRWLGLFLLLLDITRTIPLTASVPSARKMNLKFRSPALCVPQRLGRYLAA